MKRVTCCRVLNRPHNLCFVFLSLVTCSTHWSDRVFYLLAGLCVSLNGQMFFCFVFGKATV
jgi:hypothetical protein